MEKNQGIPLTAPALPLAIECSHMSDFSQLHVEEKNCPAKLEPTHRITQYNKSLLFKPLSVIVVYYIATDN